MHSSVHKSRTLSCVLCVVCVLQVDLIDELEFGAKNVSSVRDNDLNVDLMLIFFCATLVLQEKIKNKKSSPTRQAHIMQKLLHSANYVIFSLTLLYVCLHKI